MCCLFLYLSAPMSSVFFWNERPSTGMSDIYAKHVRRKKTRNSYNFLFDVDVLCIAFYVCEWICFTTLFSTSFRYFDGFVFDSCPPENGFLCEPICRKLTTIVVISLIRPPSCKENIFLFSFTEATVLMSFVFHLIHIWIDLTTMNRFLDHSRFKAPYYITLIVS